MPLSAGGWNLDGGLVREYSRKPPPARLVMAVHHQGREDACERLSTRSRADY